MSPGKNIFNLNEGKNGPIKNVDYQDLGVHVMDTKNHWSNQMKDTEHFEKVIFSYLNQIKENMEYPKGQTSRAIMDTFKGQYNNDLRELCTKINYGILIIWHILTNRSKRQQSCKSIHF